MEMSGIDSGMIRELRYAGGAQGGPPRDIPAKDLESLFLNYMLHTMQQAGRALFEEESSPDDAYLDMATESLAQLFAENGGIGLQDLIEERMKPADEVTLNKTIDRMARLTELKQPTTSFDGPIEKAAQEFDLPRDLISAVILAESGGNPKAVSPAGARGLMQLMPATGREMGMSDPFDPEANIRAGSKYLKQMVDMWDGDLTLALASYNAGPANVSRYGGVPPFQETRQYVNKVMTNYEDMSRAR